MKKQGIIISFVLLLTVVLGYFVISPSALLFLLGSPEALHAELSAIQQKIPTETGRNVFAVQSKNLTQKVDPELVDLDSQIISCDANVDNLISTGSIGGSCVGGGTTLPNVKGKFLGGQCCGAMKDTKEYHQQLQKLQVYKNIPDIPPNPYKTPVELAKKWIDYDKATSLTEKGQEVFNQALKLSKDGPCCCKCWHYYVNEGIAKKLIKDNGFNAKQIADFWDFSSIC
ncbi:MAG: hypothetical protein M1444_03020 [Patescibacteria group bacterium]|nr:hypothetical protein [Patescibacteria group bacterium]